MYKIIKGNNIEVLKQYPDNYFDSVVTDSPYGLGKEPDANKVLKAWLDHGYYEIEGKSGGFMGKTWDSFVPQPLFWKEVFRVLKPGGHLLSFFSTRTYDWGVMAIRLAGFEIRDTISWHYGSGFPKSMNIAKDLDRRGTKPDYAKKWEGWGTALKPATEPIAVCRKPIEKGITISQNVEIYRTGAINIDACRVATTEKIEGGAGGLLSHVRDNLEYPEQNKYEQNQNGRFPTNVILSHHEECEYLGVEKVKGGFTGNGDAPFGEHSKGVVKSMRRGTAIIRTDDEGMEAVEKYNCHPDCPVHLMNQQAPAAGALAPVFKSSGNSGKSNGIYSDYGTKGDNGESFKGDGLAGAARFFYCAKASPNERNLGCEDLLLNKDIGHNRFDKCKNCGGYLLQNKQRPSACTCDNPERQNNILSGNIHPTVKPIKLMQYLIKLVTPPGGTLLDPFAGSGTTGCAAELEGFDSVLIDEDESSVEISKARCKYWSEKAKAPRQVTIVFTGEASTTIPKRKK